LKEHEEEFERHLSEAGWQGRMVKLCDDLDLLPLEEGAERFVRALTEVARDSGVLCMKNKGATQIRKKSTASFSSNTWFDQDCKAANRKVNVLLRRWKLMRNAESFHHYMDQKKLFKRFTKQNKREHSRNLNARLRVLSRKDPKQFWKGLEMGKKQKKAQRSDKISQGDWVGHFAGIHQQTGTTFGLPNFPVNTVTQLDTEISTEEVHLAIDRMKDGKASGDDGLCAELFKNLHDVVMLYTLTKLFNKVFQLGHFPASWALCE